MGFTVDFTEFQKMCKEYAELQNEFEAFLHRFLLEMANRIIGQTVKNTPQDTGALRAAWAVSTSKVSSKTESRIHTNKKSKMYGKKSDVQMFSQEGDLVFSGQGKDLVVYLVNPQEYATEIEFGHRIVKGSGENKVEVGWKDGHFMLTTAISNIQREMPARFERQFQDFCKSLGIK